MRLLRHTCTRAQTRNLQIKEPTCFCILHLGWSVRERMLWCVKWTVNVLFLPFENKHTSFYYHCYYCDYLCLERTTMWNTDASTYLLGKNNHQRNERKLSCLSSWSICTAEPKLFTAAMQNILSVCVCLLRDAQGIKQQRRNCQNRVWAEGERSETWLIKLVER